MSDIIIRYLRLYCSNPAAPPLLHVDGVLAVAAIQEGAQLARLLLADMSIWGRSGGASVTNAIDQLVPAAHRHLVAGFGITLPETLIVVRDQSGHFDLVHDLGGGRGYAHTPLFGRDERITPRTPAAFLSWAGAIGCAMLAKAEAVGSGAWAGAEG